MNSVTKNNKVNLLRTTTKLKFLITRRPITNRQIHPRKYIFLLLTKSYELATSNTKLPLSVQKVKLSPVSSNEDLLLSFPNFSEKIPKIDFFPIQKKGKTSEMEPFPLKKTTMRCKLAISRETRKKRVISCVINFGEYHWLSTW